MSAAIDWVRGNGAQIGVDTSTVIVAGVSAGATIAAHIGLGGNQPMPVTGSPIAAVDGWVALSGM